MATRPKLSDAERQRRSDRMKATNAAKRAAKAEAPAADTAFGGAGDDTLPAGDGWMAGQQVSLFVIACARAAHEANRAYCAAWGDFSQLPWEDAPGWQKDSAINGVEGVLAGNNAEQSHESWLKQKIADGWKFGPVKDPEKKEHPCMVPYAELPAEQRGKDSIFVAVVTAMATALGLIPIHEAAPVSERAFAKLAGKTFDRAIDSVKLTLDHGFSDGAGRRITVEHRISPTDWASICRRLGVEDLTDHEISALLSFGKAPQG